MFCVWGKKLLLYKTILKPIWTYGTTMWGHSLSLKHRNPGDISEQSPQDVSQCPLVHTKQSPTHRPADVDRPGRSNEPQHHLQS
jgi:hypothetical protein